MSILNLFLCPFIFVFFSFMSSFFLSASLILVRSFYFLSSFSSTLFTSYFLDFFFFFRFCFLLFLFQVFFFFVLFFLQFYSHATTYSTGISSLQSYIILNILETLIKKKSVFSRLQRKSKLFILFCRRGMPPPTL